MWMNSPVAEPGLFRNKPFLKRRSFIRNTGLAALATAASPALHGKATTSFTKPFTLNFAPHLGMFRAHAGTDPLDELRFIADSGFRAFEDNEMPKRPVALQKQIGQFLEDRGMKMGVFVAHTIAWSQPNLASGDPELRRVFLEEIKASVAVAKRVGARWMTVVPGHVDMKQSMAFQTAHVVRALREAAEILKPHELTMVLEPLNFRDHPGQFLSGIPSGL